MPTGVGHMGKFHNKINGRVTVLIRDCNTLLV